MIKEDVMSEYGESLIRATSCDDNLIIVFDGKEFARTVASCIKELHCINPEMAKSYAEAMSGVSLKIENCSVQNDKSKHGI